MKHLLYWLFQVVLGAGIIGVAWLVSFLLKLGSMGPQTVIVTCIAVFVWGLVHYLKHGPTLRGFFWRKPAWFARLTVRRGR